MLFLDLKYMDRPKTGFSLPIYSWLRRDLSYLIEEYLSKEAIPLSGIFDESFVFEKVQQFKQGKFHYSPVIWYLLMFQRWYRRWISND